MKYCVYGCLLVLGIVLSVKAETPAFDSNYEYAGIVWVGNHPAAECTLSLALPKVESNRPTISTANLYAPRYIGTFSWGGRSSMTLGMENYSGQFLGSRQSVSAEGVAKKTTIQLFFDEGTQKYKVIAHEANLKSVGSVGKFVVCGDMILRLKTNLKKP